MERTRVKRPARIRREYGWLVVNVTLAMTGAVTLYRHGIDLWQLVVIAGLLITLVAASLWTRRPEGGIGNDDLGRALTPVSPVFVPHARATSSASLKVSPRCHAGASPPPLLGERLLSAARGLRFAF